MTPQEFLSARMALDATQPQDLADHRKEFLRMNKRHIGSEIICYLVGAACLAALGTLFNDSAMVVVASIVATALALAYLLASKGDQRDFARATKAVSVHDLPNKLTLISDADPSVRVQLAYLLNNQNEEIYRYQITGLYDMGRQQRIRALQTAQ